MNKRTYCFALVTIFTGLACGTVVAETKVPSNQSASALAGHSRTFKDWKVICQSDKCRMAQTIMSKTTREKLLQVRIYAGKQPTAVLTFPLGILLSTGWRLRANGGKERLFPFEICNLDGCHAGIKMSPSLINEFKRGKTALVLFYDSVRKPVKLNISLAGFTLAFAALGKSSGK